MISERDPEHQWIRHWRRGADQHDGAGIGQTIEAACAAAMHLTRQRVVLIALASIRTPPNSDSTFHGIAAALRGDRQSQEGQRDSVDP